MPYISYMKPKKFHKKTLAMIKAADRISAAYLRAGIPITVRGLFYQFVTKNLIKNTFQQYKVFGEMLKHGRNCGMIDWEAIIDRTRELDAKPHWTSAAHMLESVKDQYNLDMWKNQKHHIEVWIEKDALVGAIEAVCREFDLPFLACKGFASLSELWRAGNRFKRADWDGRKCIIFYLGDHDPSGLEMRYDVESRAKLYAGFPVEVIRLGLNIDQIREYDPPANFVKLGDSRSPGYVAQFGHDSWELDALSPDVIANLIREAVEPYIDEEEWLLDAAKEQDTRDRLADVAAIETEREEDMV